MSYDVTLIADLGGPEPAVIWNQWNYTSNIEPMLAAAGGFSIKDLHGLTAQDAETRLLDVCTVMMANPDRFIALELANGWGCFDGPGGVLTRLEQLGEACARYPLATVRVSA